MKHLSTKSRYTTISITTPYDNSGDLEAGTPAIAEVAKPAVPQYTDSNGLTAPSDSRLICKNLGVRMTVDVDSFNAGCAHLNYSIDIGSLTAQTGSIDAAGAGALVAKNITLVGASEVVGKTAKIYFWVDAGNAVISKVQLQLAYGTSGSTVKTVFQFTTSCIFELEGIIEREGTGTVEIILMTGGTTGLRYIGDNAGLADGTLINAGASLNKLHIASEITFIKEQGSVATDLVYVSSFGVSIMEV